MNRTIRNMMLAATIMLAIASPAQAAIDGVAGPNFALTAKAGHISTPEGGAVYTWGFSNGSSHMQYPGPTLIVNQDATVTVTLTNELAVPVSIVFPGQQGVVAEQVSAPTAPGSLTLEAGAATTAPLAPGGTVRYTFTASRPGTYMYHSGTHADLQVPMGLVGALIVRPRDSEGAVISNQAYNHADTAFDDEFLFLMTEMDPSINAKIEDGKMNEVDTAAFFPVVWFLNGRCAPDTMSDAFVEWLPAQPYNCMPMMRPGEKILMRLVGAGRDSHPFHYHGNHARVIARDGRMLASGPSTGPDIGPLQFTIQTLPGETDDAIFTWTGEKLGWDIYGHMPGDPLAANAMGDVVEYAPDHGKPIPVTLPSNQDLAFGPMWSGSPFLGVQGDLPPGEGRFDVAGSYYYMWHSHTEKEMVNNDIFPGGMMTMLMIMPPVGDMPMPMKTQK